MYHFKVNTMRLFYIKSDNKITHYQDKMDKEIANNLAIEYIEIVDDEVNKNLKELYHFVTLDSDGNLPTDWYEKALIEQQKIPTPRIAEIEAELKTNASLKIKSSYESDILGTIHTYPSSNNDQLNLIAAASSYESRMIMCMDNTNEWRLRLHTQSQAQKVLETNITRIEKIRQELAEEITLLHATPLLTPN